MDGYKTFNTAPYAAYTTKELRDALFVAPEVTRAKMEAEIARREAVARGDVSQMTPGERLRRTR